jgi:hypothetical protein
MECGHAQNFLALFLGAARGACARRAFHNDTRRHGQQQHVCTPMIILSRASSKSWGSIADAFRFAAIKAAEFTMVYKSAPEKPGVDEASRSTFTSAKHTPRIHSRARKHASARRGQPRASKSWRTLCSDDFRQVQRQNVTAAFTIGQVHRDLGIKSARPRERRVKYFSSVCCSCTRGTRTCQ